MKPILSKHYRITAGNENQTIEVPLNAVAFAVHASGEGGSGELYVTQGDSITAPAVPATNSTLWAGAWPASGSIYSDIVRMDSNHRKLNIYDPSPLATRVTLTFYANCKCR